MTGPAGDSDASIARPADRRGGLGCMIGFFAVFLLAGLGFEALFVWPLYQTIVARTSWTPVPCEVLESSVETHPGDDSDTYSVAVRYRYEVGGRPYESDRYQFFSGSTGGYEGKARVVESLPPGSVTTCRVDPENPAAAVLLDRITGEYWLALMPLVFILVGAGGIVFTLTGVRDARRRKAAGVPDWLPKVPRKRKKRKREDLGDSRQARLAAWSAETAASGPTVLEAQWSPFGKLVGVILLAAIWNGITGVFVWLAWKSWAEGSPDGCLTLFILPFVLVGLLLLVGVPYQILALFNPRPRLELAPGRVVLGGTHELSWSFRGRAGRIRRLKITLEGAEEADYRQGDDTRSDRETFATHKLVDVVRGGPAGSPARGTALLSLPADTMHSFDGSDHRIVWKLKVHGEVAGWPDVSEELPLAVHPLPIEEAT